MYLAWAANARGPRRTARSRGYHAVPPTHRVQLLIADRRPTAADGIAAALADALDVVVAGSCHEAELLSKVLGSGNRIEAVVIDAEMFDGNASRAVAAIRLLDPGVAVLLLTTRVDDALLEALAQERVSCVSAYSEAQPSCRHSVR